jgi:esterase
VTRLIVADIAPVTYRHSQSDKIAAMRAVDLDAVERRSDADAQLAGTSTIRRSAASSPVA